jgi:hypothetical protein
MTIEQHAALRHDETAPAPTPEVVPAPASYRYEIHLHARKAPIHRWRGRVVACDPTGRRHHWRWHASRSRDRLLSELWRETIFDIRWRTGRTASIEIVEH